MRILIGTAAAIGLSTVVLAGDLNPPAGPVTPTNKTLREIDSRIVVNQDNTPGDPNAVFVIANPGSYLLVDSFTVPPGMVGIRIESRCVTLNLGGHKIEGDPLSDDLIRMVLGPPIILPTKGITVKNGTLEGGGADGIDGTGVDDMEAEFLELIRQAQRAIAAGDNFTGNKVEVDGAGTTGVEAGVAATLCEMIIRNSGDDGVSVQEQLLAKAVRTLNNGGNGVTMGEGAVLEGLEAAENGLFGGLVPLPTPEGPDVDDCRFNGNGSGGLSAGGSDKADVKDSAACNNGGSGFVFGDGAKVTGSKADNNGGNGLEVDADALIREFQAVANALNGITAGDNAELDAVKALDNILTGTLIPLPSPEGPDVADSLFNGNGAGGFDDGGSGKTNIRNSSACGNGGDGFNLGDDARLEGANADDNNGNGVTADERAFLEAVRSALNTLDGVNVGDAAVMNDVEALNNGGDGIRALLRLHAEAAEAIGNTIRGCWAGDDATLNNCLLSDNGGVGAQLGNLSSITNSQLHRNGNVFGAAGLQLGDAVVVRDCVMSSHNNGQIFAGQDCSISGNTLRFTNVPGAVGILVGPNSRVLNNFVHNIVVGAGIQTNGAGCLVADNRCVNNGVGIQMSDFSSYLRNRCSQNPGGDFNVTPFAQYGPIVNIAGAGDIGGVPNSQHPQANFID